MIRSGTIRANGLTFGYLEAGEGPLVLLFHGFPDRPSAWNPILEGLAAAGFRAVAPAMRGYVPSEIPADGDYRVATLGRDVLALIEAFGAERAAIVGHDWGAAAVYAAANLGPERVSHLVAVAIPHLRIARPSLSVLLRARHFTLFQLGPYARWYARRKNFAYIDYLYHYWSPTWPDPSAHIDAVKQDFRQPGRLRAAISYYAAMRASLRKNEENRTLRARTTQPSLLIVGEDDGGLDFEHDFAGIEDCFTGPMRLVHVPHAGHFVPAEQPEAVTREIVAFLRA